MKVSTLEQDQIGALDRFFKTLFFIFSQPNFHIPDNFVPLLIPFSQMVGQMVLISRYQTTDKIIAKIHIHPSNAAKILFLYSMYNKKRLDVKRLFASLPLLLYQWYCSFYFIRPDLVTRESHEYFREAIDVPIDPSLSLRWFTPYFLVSYIDPDMELAVKDRINRICKHILNAAQIRNVPDFNKIVVISKNWSLTNAVYNSLAGYIRSLKASYHLTLLNLADSRHPIDVNMFDDVINMNANDNEVIPITRLIELLSSNDFGLAYFPDIGMNPESIMLSNLRIAPIQIMGYGHPVSTYGTSIDYVITGKKCEKYSDVGRFYSERVILLPELGAIPERRPYTPSGLKSGRKDAIVVSCSWGVLKTNYPMVRLLKQAISKCDKRLLFKFTGIECDSFTYPSFVKQIKRILGDKYVTIVPVAPYSVYMEHLETCDFAIDSYPFGGFNRVLDSLQAGLPIVTLKGDKLPSRLASAILDELGLGELVTESKGQFVEKIIQLARNEEYRENLRKRITAIDTETRLYNNREMPYFKKAVDYLVAHHEVLKNDIEKKPLIIL